MPVTTRAQAKRNADSEYVASRVGVVPDIKFHDLANDMHLADDLYGKNFMYNFSDWPRSCWLMPKHNESFLGFFGVGTRGRIAEFFKELKLVQMMPYAYRYHNPNRQIDVELEVSVFSWNNTADTHLKKYQCCYLDLGMETMDVVQAQCQLVDHFATNLEADHWISGFDLERIHKITIKQSQ